MRHATSRGGVVVCGAELFARCRIANLLINRRALPLHIRPCLLRDLADFLHDTAQYLRISRRQLRVPLQILQIALDLRKAARVGIEPLSADKRRYGGIQGLAAGFGTDFGLLAADGAR